MTPPPPWSGIGRPICWSADRKIPPEKRRVLPRSREGKTPLAGFDCRGLLGRAAGLEFLSQLLRLGAVLAGFRAQFDDSVAQFAHFILQLADGIGHRVGCWRCRCTGRLRPTINASDSRSRPMTPNFLIEPGKRFLCFTIRLRRRSPQSPCRTARVNSTTATDLFRNVTPIVTARCEPGEYAAASALAQARRTKSGAAAGEKPYPRPRFFPRSRPHHGPGRFFAPR